MCIIINNQLLKNNKSNKIFFGWRKKTLTCCSLSEGNASVQMCLCVQLGLLSRSVGNCVSGPPCYPPGNLHQVEWITPFHGR